MVENSVFQGGTGGFIKWQAVERKKTAYAGIVAIVCCSNVLP